MDIYQDHSPGASHFSGATELLKEKPTWPLYFPMRLCYYFPRTTTLKISGRYLVPGQVGLTG